VVNLFSLVLTFYYKNMSNIYVQEPPTNGKVLLITTVGDIDVELWSKEAPKACRNFVQLCLEGYYDGTIFHRLVPDFIVQGGDPTGTGSGGESIYGKTFQDEFHSRLRFVRRGLVAMANSGPNDNASQFFFTLAATPELNNKHTIFGKVGGNTIYNMLKLGEGETDHSERPVYPQKIIKTKIILNPFEDIVPRVKKTKSDAAGSGASKKSDVKAAKNFKLLSFGEEAEEEEREVSEVAQALRGKGKSSHDLLRDNTLSSVPAVDTSDIGEDKKSLSESAGDDYEVDYKGQDIDESGATAESVRKKLKVEQDKAAARQLQQPPPAADDVSSSLTKSGTRLAELKAEAKQLKKDLSAARSRKMNEQPAQNPVESTASDSNLLRGGTTNSEISAFRAERRKYKEQSQKLAKRGSAREDETLKMLAAFQAKMDSARKLAQLVSAASDDDDKSNIDEDADKEDEEGGDDANDFSWTHRTLHFDADGRKVLDANVHDVDRYEIFDPRNPLTVRRREASARTMKEKH
jgi:peptidyl-prolyl cis-trans isomerase SDCCAG10